MKGDLHQDPSFEFGNIEEGKQGVKPGLDVVIIVSRLDSRSTNLDQSSSELACGVTLLDDAVTYLPPMVTSDAFGSF